MRDRLQGAAAGGGVGAVGMAIQAAQQYAAESQRAAAQAALDAQRASVEAASQEALVELLNVTVKMCGGGG